MKERKLVIFCSVLAAICFAIASYGHFLRGRTWLGILYAALTVMQIVLAVINISAGKKGR